MANKRLQGNWSSLTFVRELAWRTLLLAVLILGAQAISHAQVSVGIQIGAPPAPRVLAVIPATPGPDYVWVQGYWYPVGRRYRWHEGYWTLPPYPGARWVSPRHDGERYFAGYWDGDRGRLEHDHKWDKEHDRDSGRWHDHDEHGHGDHDNQGEDHGRH